MVRIAPVSRGMIPANLEQLERTICEKYPDLRLVVENGKPLFRGSFPVVHDGEVLDRFLIEISFPEGITKVPVIHEIGGRIPRTLDRHMYPSGAICAEVPELTLLRGGFSLLSYLDGPVHNFFLGQSLVERGEQWPFGQWEHGKSGLIQAYGELLGQRDEQKIRRYLDCLSHKKVKGHWPCPCDSGKPIRQCHVAVLRTLQARISPRIARQALQRLAQCRW